MPVQYQKAIIPCNPSCINATTSCKQCKVMPSCQKYNISLAPLFPTSVSLWCEDQQFSLTTSPLTKAQVTTSLIEATGETITSGISNGVTSGDSGIFTTGSSSISTSQTSTGLYEGSPSGAGNRTIIAAAAGGMFSLWLITYLCSCRRYYYIGYRGGVCSAI